MPGDLRFPASGAFSLPPTHTGFRPIWRNCVAGCTRDDPAPHATWKEPESLLATHDPTFVVYIDESGDEGFQFGAGSSQWFVLSAVIVRRAEDLQTVKLVDVVRAQLRKPPRKPLHFRRLKHEQRVPFVDRVARADLCASSVLIHKPSLSQPETFREPHGLYFYAVRYLLERTSWYCRDQRTQHDVGDGSAQVVFSHRSGLPYRDMREYLALLNRESGALDVRIDWSAIKTDQIVAVTAGRRMGLQIADAVAGSMFYAVEPTQWGYTEDRYACILRPVVYSHAGRYLGYGLKFFPNEVEALVDSEDQFAWVRSHYK